MTYSKFNKIGWIILTIIFALLLAACDSDSPDAGQNNPGIEVEISETNCPSIIVRVGDNAVWTNSGDSDLVVHIENNEGEVIFESGRLQPGDSYSITFSEEASYNYRCTADRELTSTIVVEP